MDEVIAHVREKYTARFGVEPGLMCSALVTARGTSRPRLRPSKSDSHSPRIGRAIRSFSAEVAAFAHAGDEQVVVVANQAEFVQAGDAATDLHGLHHQVTGDAAALDFDLRSRFATSARHGRTSRTGS